jgi:succinoglycan biosynthesis protein ExoM
MTSDPNAASAVFPATAAPAANLQTHDAGIASEESWVVVAVLTYGRAATLNRLLVEFAGLLPPRATRVTLLVIDNHEKGCAQALFDTHASLLVDARYVQEKRRGIPVARNRAVSEAIAMGADALCFIDDDEFPNPDWLHHLVGCWKSSRAHLVGGPVRVAAPEPFIGPWCRFLTKSLAARAERKNLATARAAARGRRFTVVTNNWLCDVHWLVRTGVRFDDQLLYTGGSDTVFHRAAKAAGAVTAWCPEAVVYEIVPAERLTLAYQFHRAASQSINHFRMKNKRLTAGIATIAVLNAVVRCLSGSLLLMFPIYGVASPVIAVRSLGWSYGRLMALRGARSKLYA